MRVDPLADHPNQVDKSPYAAFWNNPIKYNDPDGRCPQCLVGFAIGFGLDVAAQMLLEGKSLSEVNYTSAAISGVSGAVSGGISSVAKFGKYSTMAVNAAIDGSESIAKQVASGQDISVTQVASDVGMGYVGGNVKVFGDANIKTKENQLNRAERIAAGDPTSAGRAQNVIDKKASLNNANNLNSAASTATSNTLQNASDKTRSYFNYSNNGSTISIPEIKTVQDNTRVMLPIIDKKIRIE